MVLSAIAAPSVAQEPAPPADSTTATSPAPSQSPGTSPPAVTPAQEAPPAATAAPTAPPESTAQPAPSASEGAPAASQSTDAPGTEHHAQPAATPGAVPSSSDPAFPADPDQAAQDGSADAPAASAEPSHLPRDLSPWGMFMAADIVVKAVMIGLAFASVVTWTVWLAKTLELTWAKRRLTQAFAAINGSSSLAEAAQRLGGKKGIVSGLIELAAVELHLSADVSDKAGIKERVTSRLDGLAAAAGRDMNRGTGVLATIGSTSPFVGLFGTVWGIMNSFIGISEAQTTNLAIVAPGIAEALLATALGLVAAIPAVIIYNHFARQIGGYKAMIGEVSGEVLRLVSRDLDRGFRVVPAARAAE